jgi:purine-binding chemotaxis protein CheW
MTNAATDDIFQDSSKNYLKNLQKKQFLTMRVGNQAFGLPVKKVQDVLRPQKITRIPLARPEVLGLINLRGRIVTVIDLKKRLGLGQIDEELTKSSKNRLVVVEFKGELYSLVVDEIGDVLDLPLANFEKSPENLSSAWKEISQGVFKLQNILLLVLDTENLLSIK